MTTMFWILSFVWVNAQGVHNILGVSDSNGTPFADKDACAATAVHVATEMNLPQKSWRYECHEMDVVANSSEKTVFVKFPNY